MNTHTPTIPEAMKHHGPFRTAGGLLLLALLSGLLPACGTGGAASEAPAADTIPVRVMTVRSAPQAMTVEVPGLFTTNDEAALSFLVSGIVQQVKVQEGDAVKAGQLLATLDPTAINTQLEQAQLAFDKAERDQQRAQALFADSVASLQTLQNARTALDLARQQLTAARYARQHAEIRADGDGFVLRKFVNPGQLVDAGTPVLLVNGAGRGPWMLEAGLSDKDWARVRTGDSADVRCDAFPDAVMHAVVESRSMGADPRSGTFQVKLRILGPGPRLASGLYGKATIHVPGRDSLTAIPYEALLDGDGGHGLVFLADGGKARRLPVAVHELRADSALVSGPRPGQQLIVQGGPYLNDGSLIRVERAAADPEPREP